jgi:hypothetical protein
MSLTTADVVTLDSVMRFLADPSPYFPVAPPAPRVGMRRLQTLFAVCGNWYDTTHKARALAKAANHRPQSTLLLTGGRKERLTPPEAVALGGEPMLLQSVLALRYNISRTRMVLYTGSRITNHNLQAINLFASTAHRFERRPLSLQLVEEAFLVRREAAALFVMLRRNAAARRALRTLLVKRNPPRPLAHPPSHPLSYPGGAIHSFRDHAPRRRVDLRAACGDARWARVRRPRARRG